MSFPISRFMPSPKNGQVLWCNAASWSAFNYGWDQSELPSYLHHLLKPKTCQFIVRWKLNMMTINFRRFIELVRAWKRIIWHEMVTVHFSKCSSFPWRCWLLSVQPYSSDRTKMLNILALCLDKLALACKSNNETSWISWAGIIPQLSALSYSKIIYHCCYHQCCCPLCRDHFYYVNRMHLTDSTYVCVCQVWLVYTYVHNFTGWKPFPNPKAQMMYLTIVVWYKLF
jgi:hypothetical protein